MQFLMNVFITQIATNLINLLVGALAPRALAGVSGRPQPTCPVCGTFAPARWAPRWLLAANMVGVVVFALGFTFTLLGTVVLAIVALSAVTGNAPGWSTIGFLALAVAGSVAGMALGALPMAWYQRHPLRSCAACRSQWPRGAPVPEPAPPRVLVPRPWRRDPVALRATYTVALVGGLAGAAYIYCGGGFNRLDEGQLAAVAPMWFLPIVFGLYGLVMQRAARLYGEGRADTRDEAMASAVSAVGSVGLVGLPPFLLRRWTERSIVIAVAAVLYWAALLWLFLALIFPAL